MNRFILIFTGIFLFALTIPALSLTLQERMNLIKQKELQRKEQIKSEHDKKRASQLAIKVEADDSTSVFVSNGGTEITKNNTNETSKKNQLGIVTAIAADQVWEYRLTGWVHRILINKVEGNKISVFYTATDKYNNTSASLLDGDYVAEQGTFVLTLTAFIKKRLSYQLSGKLLNGRLVAEVDTGRGQRQWTYNLNKTNQFEESFYRYRTFYQKREKQKKIEKYYQELVITPEVDEYGVKTFATMKLEYEKNFLRPLNDKEIETLKQNRVNAVQSAIQKAEYEASRPEVVVFGVPLHSTTIGKLRKTIEKKGGKLVVESKSKHLMKFDASRIIPGIKHIVVSYTNDNKVSSYAYVGIKKSIADNIFKTLTAKYGRADTQGGFAKWYCKNNVKIEYQFSNKSLSEMNVFNPEMDIIYTTEHFKQYSKEEKIRKNLATRKDMDQRKNSQAF